MFGKSARQKRALFSCLQASEQIHLPWLCPVFYELPVNAYSLRSIRHRTLLCWSPRRRSLLYSPRRSASTAAASDLPRPDSYPLHPTPPPAPDINISLTETFPDFMSHDPKSPMILDLTAATKLDESLHIPTNKTKGGRTLEDLRTTLRVCLQANDFDRAIGLLKKLQRSLSLTSPVTPVVLRHAFNDYLEAMVKHMITYNDNTNVDRINNLLEVDMHEAGIEPDARTYALKVKVALATLTGNKRDRTVKKYWDLAQKQERVNEAASLPDMLSEQELGQLSEIAPQLYGLDGYDDLSASGDSVEIVESPILAQRAVEQVREQSQRGLGLISLRRTLALFGNGSKDDVRLTSNDAMNAPSRQLRLEEDAVKTAVERWRIEHEKMVKMGLGTRLQRGQLRGLMWEWHQKLAQKLREVIDMVEAAGAKSPKGRVDPRHRDVFPFLRLLEPEHLSAVACISLLAVMDSNKIHGNFRLSGLACRVGEKVEAEVAAEQDRVASEQGQVSRKQVRSERSPKGTLMRAFSRTRSSSRQFQRIVRSYTNNFSWGPTIHALVGITLCEFFFDIARIPMSKQDPLTGKRMQVTQPVFNHEILFNKGKRFGVVTLHPEWIAQLTKEPTAALVAKFLPMLCEARPWEGFQEGGYLSTRQPFVRLQSGKNVQAKYAEAAAERGDLDQLFAGVNVLGKTAWTINKRLLEVMLRVWNSGEGIAGFPPIKKELEEPKHPTGDSDNASRIKWFQTMRKIENVKKGLHSVRCFQNFQLEIARAFLNETFYLPHNIDFRGRAYPLPPYLNQMGADHCRSLLLFAKGKELGADGLRWIKIHLSNVFGYDKASLGDRENFPMEHLAQISDSVERPLDGQRWWLKAEDPWQCLAACFELKQALDLSDPTKFVSHLPVHQDGSCNGLQHYAALGGDVVGAKQVNLMPGDKPSDIYTGVAELIKVEIAKEAAAGDPLARLLEGKISRRIVKQTVMTNVYGVTFLGGVRQIRKQLEGILLGTEFSALIVAAAVYIATKIFNALKTMFSGANEIQHWLTDAANKITTSISPAQSDEILAADARNHADSSSGIPETKTDHLNYAKLGSKLVVFRSGVIWTSPLRLPVVQPYRMLTERRVRTNLQALSISEPSVLDPVHRAKQVQAFPPNFIHSLDATHMHLSALKCHEVGLTFSAVHDSFWTHAADVTTLNRLLRDAFIRMHSEDIVGRLAAEFQVRYKDHVYLATVGEETPSGVAITNYRKALHRRKLSATKVRERQYVELVMEIRRQRLLKSTCADERKKGEGMATAAALFDKVGGQEQSMSQDSVPTRPLIDAETIEKALQSEDHADDVSIEPALEPLVAQQDHPAGLAKPGGDGNADGEEGTKPSPNPSVTTHTNSSAHDTQATAAKRKGGKKSPGKVWLWLPLRFKPVPRKVDQIVARSESRI